MSVDLTCLFLLISFFVFWRLVIWDEFSRNLAVALISACEPICLVGNNCDCVRTICRNPLKNGDRETKTISSSAGMSLRKLIGVPSFEKQCLKGLFCLNLRLHWSRKLCILDSIFLLCFRWDSVSFLFNLKLGFLLKTISITVFW